MYTHVNMHNTHKYTHKYIYKHIHKCNYTYTYYTHKYTQTYTYIQTAPLWVKEASPQGHLRYDQILAYPSGEHGAASKNNEGECRR